MDRLVGTHALDSLADTRALAKEIAPRLEPGTVLLLTGELGSGKTAFTQALAAALGVREALTSPTFTIAAEYATIGHPTIAQVVHIDLYRLSRLGGEDQAYLQDLLDSASGHRQVIVIEWADRLGGSSPAGWKFHFSHGIKPTERIVKIEKPEARNPKS